MIRLICNRFYLALLACALLSPTVRAQGGTQGLGIAYVSDIQTYLFLEASQGRTNYDMMQAPRVTIFNGVTFPARGIGEFYNEGYTFNINVVKPVGPGRVTPGGAYQQWGLNTGFTYSHWNPNNNSTLNQPRGQNFDINGLDSYRAEIGPAFWSVRPLGDNRAWFWGVGVNGLLGSMNADLPVGKFNANQAQETIIGPPTTSAFAGGFAVRANTGFILANGWKVSVEGGYEGVSTSVITGRTEYTDGYFVGGTLSMPLGNRTPTLSRLPYVNRLFRNAGIGLDSRPLMLMVTPRIITPNPD